MRASLASLFVASAVAACIHDDRVEQLDHKELFSRSEIQAFAPHGMWKMPSVAYNAPESTLEDCGTCQEAEVQVELMKKNVDGKEQMKVQGIYALHANEWDMVEDLKQKAGNIKFSSIVHPTEEAIEQNKDTHLAELKQATKGPGAFFKKNPAAYGDFLSNLDALKRANTGPDGLYLVMKTPSKKAYSVSLGKDWEQRLNNVVSQVPKDFDVLMLSSGKANTRCEDLVPATKNIYEVRRPMRTPEGDGQFYRGIEAYVVRRRSIPKILEELQKVEAQPINVMLMSVHGESADKGSDSKIYYKALGIYSYMLEDPELIVKSV